MAQVTHNVNDLPTQYKPFFKSLDKGRQRMIEIVWDPVLTKEQKIDMISEVGALMEANRQRIIHYVRVGVVDSEAEMDALITKQTTPVVP